MTIREAAPSREHQALVGHLIKWISTEGFEIRCANYDDYEACAKVKDYIPDARGYRTDDGLVCYGESKTEDDIDNEHAREQFKEFARRVMASGKSKDKKCPFYITIDQGSETVLKRVLDELDLDKPHVKWKAFQV
jgi:hypothetical protein